MALTVGDENYRKLKRRESEIVYQLAAERCSADLALRLFSAEVIKDRIYQEGDNFGPHVVETDRIKVLLDAVIGTVKQNPSRFTTFIRVLRDMGLKDVSDFVNRPLKDDEARKMAYVTDVKVISGSHEQISPSYDYTKIDVDLNAGAWGKYIYLCYKSGERDDAITGLQVIMDSSASPSVPPGYTKISQDLNEGAGGKYIYLCFTKTPKLPPIKGLEVIHGDTPHIWPQDPAYVRINADLNTGAGGQYIYLGYRYD